MPRLSKNKNETYVSFMKEKAHKRLSFFVFPSRFFLRRWWQLDLHFKNTCPGCRRCLSSSADTYILPSIIFFGVKRRSLTAYKVENIFYSLVTICQWLSRFFAIFHSLIAEVNECRATVLCARRHHPAKKKAARRFASLIFIFLISVINENMYTRRWYHVGRLAKTVH